MKLKKLESVLQDVVGFNAPKIELEQYPTSPHIASRILFTAHSAYDDIEDKAVIDLGCGTGMFAVGAAVLGSAYTLGVDIDTDALSLAAQNIEEYDVDVDLIQADATGEGLGGLAKRFDTVLMNPPFGTRNRGVDVAFLQVALQISRHAVYSLHKSSTRDYLLKKAQTWGVEAEVVAQLRYDLPRSYAFHKRQSVDIEVDLLRFQHPLEQTDAENNQSECLKENAAAVPVAQTPE